MRCAVVGAGFIGSGLVRQLAITPGLAPSIVVNRTPERARDAYAGAGADPTTVFLDDDPARISQAIADDRPVITRSPDVLGQIPEIDLVIEATGAMNMGARLMLDALRAGRDVVSMNAEVDATIGWLLHEEARRTGAVYSICDGDQPGVLLRHLAFVRGMGFEIVAAVNCKRNLDVHQNPTDSQPYADRDGTSVLMTTAFGDGTKMQIENAVVANLTGLVPDRRGMHGVRTTVADAARDIVAAISEPGVVEYTLGGDFAGGVCVIGRGTGPQVQPYMRYSKMGEGPDYVFFRPYHLLHFEAAFTIADVVLDRRALGTPAGPPVAEVTAIAKKDLQPGERLDGIGGYCCYGHVDSAAGAAEHLPIGLAEGARVLEAVVRDQPVPLSAVEIDEEAGIVRLRREQERLLASARSGATERV